MTIVEAIQLGLRRGYILNGQFQNQWSEINKKMIEYLLTVSVASELNSYNAYGKYPIILMEHSLCEFRNNAFPLFKYDDSKTIEGLFQYDRPVRRKYNAGKGSKRIDIAISYWDGVAGIRSMHGVELKAINQSYKKVKTDIVRLADSMTNIDPTDCNSITGCYSAFIKAYKKKGGKGSYEKDIIKEKAKFRNEIQAVLKHFNNTYTTLSFKVYESEIRNLTIETLIEQGEQMGDIDNTSDNLHKTGLVLGIVIEITRK